MTITIHPTFYGDNAALWAIAVDADVGRSWGGAVLDDDYEYVEGCDFLRAMQADDEEEYELPIGDGSGLLVDIGDCGFSPVWEREGTFLLLYYRPSGSADPRRHREAIGERVFSLAAVDEPRVIGDVAVPSKVLALINPGHAGIQTEDDIAGVRADGSALAIDDNSILLLHAPADSYRVSVERLDHADEVVRYIARILIAPIGSGARG